MQEYSLEKLEMQMQNIWGMLHVLNCMCENIHKVELVIENYQFIFNT